MKLCSVTGKSRVAPYFQRYGALEFGLKGLMCNLQSESSHNLSVYSLSNLLVPFSLSVLSSSLPSHSSLPLSPQHAFSVSPTSTFICPLYLLFSFQPSLCHPHHLSVSPLLHILLLSFFHHLFFLSAGRLSLASLFSHCSLSLFQLLSFLTMISISFSH